MCVKSTISRSADRLPKTAAVNPYLAFESVEDLSRKGYLNVDAETAVKNLTNALSTGVLKIMAKMGVHPSLAATVAPLAIRNHQLNKGRHRRNTTGTTSRVGGVGLDELAEEVAIRHRVAYPSQWTARPHRNCTHRQRVQVASCTGEDHLNDPASHLPAPASHPAQ